ncbi:hypothetical protein N0V86_002137 [Didymella sp. IMI 355093]|nr:hypothetical protein N0V86_002137 [Didymella sp. IMI 355093]
MLAAALLLASLPYGLALPQVLPLVGELAPDVTPSPLSLIPALDASTVTVIGTIVQPAVESAVEDVTDAIEDATETIATALESATDAIESALPTDDPSILDPEANILPLILPGILPVETDLPPVDAPDVVPSGLPDTNSLETTDLPAPSEVPSGDNSLTAEPYFPDLPDEATVPISTFNAVVQPLLSVIQTLLNSLPGNFAPPLSGILPHPLLPTETPDIFVDPLLPTETSSDAVATATDAVDSVNDPLIDSILTSSIGDDLPFTKRQAATDFDTNSIVALIAPILDAIKSLLAQIPAGGPAVPDVASGTEAAAPALPIDVPALPSDAPPLPIPDITLPNLPLPSVTAPDIIPTDDLPVDVSAPALPGLPLTTPPALPDLTSGIPAEVLNVPVPDDVEGIDWSAFQSPPISDLPAPSLDNLPIPDDVLNVPVPDFDENGLPIETPVNAVSDATTALPAALPTNLDTAVADALTAVPAALPTSLDASGDLPDSLPDWPFSNIPQTFTPDVSGELPDLQDLATPLASLALPTDLLGAAAPTVPTALLNVPVPTNLLDVPVPTNLLDAPVPEGFEDIPDIATALPATPSLADLPIPDDVLNLPWPELDENGIPIDQPVNPVSSLAAPPAPLPTNLNWWDVPVPDDWVDDATSILPAPTVPTDVVPDVLPPPQLPDGILNLPIEGPAALTGPFTDVPTDAISGLPTSDLADVLPAPPALTGLPELFPTLPAPTNVLAAAPSVAAPTLPAVAPAIAPAIPALAPPVAAPVRAPALSLPAVPAINLPFQVPGARGPLGKRQLSNLLAQTKLRGRPSAAAPPPANAATAIAIPLVDSLLQLVSALFAQISGARQSVPDLNASLASVSALLPNLPLPSLSVPVPEIASVVSALPLPDASSLVSSLPIPEVANTLPEPADLPDADGIVGGVVPSIAIPDVTSILPTPAPDASGLLGGVAPSLAAPDVASILPAPPGLSDIGGIASTLTGADAGLPAVDDVASIVTAPLDGGAPGLPDFTGVASTVTNAAPAGVLSGLGKLKKRQFGFYGLPFPPAPLPFPPFGVPFPPAGVPGLSLPPAGVPVPPFGVPFPPAGVPGLSLPPAGVPVPPFGVPFPPAGVPGLSLPPAGVPVPPAGVPFSNLGGLTGALGGGVLPNANKLVPTVTGGIKNVAPIFDGGALQGIGELASKVAGAAPGVGEIASTVAGAAAKVPVAFDSGLTKTLIPTPLPLNPSALPENIESLLSKIQAFVNSLPVSSVSAPALDVVAPVLASATGAVAPILATANVAVAPVLASATDAVAPVLAAATGAVAPVLSTLGGTADVVAPVLAVATGGVAPILAVATGGVAPILAAATGAVAPIISTVGGTAGGVNGLIEPATNVLGGVGSLGLGVPLARRATEESQQGPASDWEAFLGELDESKQPELAGLIHDSAKAVNNNNFNALADTLKSDFEDLSDDTKSTLLEGFGATTFEKRSMRHGKRQEFAGVPGVQSIGPNLDDATKIDVSGFNLDPNNQLSGLAAGGTPVDSDSPPAPGSSAQLAGSAAGLGDPELLHILANGGLDPNGMLSSPVGGAPVDDVPVAAPYADVRQNLEPAFGASQPLEGLDATLQAAKNNHFSGKNPGLSWVPEAGGSATAQQANVLQWFQRSVKPSWNKNVDAEMIR